MTSRFNTYFFLLLITVLFSGSGFAQPVASYENVLAAFPEDYLVVSKLKTRYEFRMINNKPYVKVEKYTEYLYMNDKAVSANSHSFRYSPTFEEDLKYEAYVYTPNSKGKLKKEKVKPYSIANKASSGIFYDDQKEMKFVYPNIKKGSFASLSHKTLLNEPRLLPAFYFERGLLVLDAEVEYIVPAGFEVKFSLYGDTLASLQNTMEMKGTSKIYRWSAKNIRSLPDEDNSPAFSSYAPHVVCVLQSYKDKNGVNQPVLSSTDDLYKWYSNFVAGINQGDHSSLYALVDSLTAGVTDTLEKVKNIYSWVQSKLKYVAFEDGMGGFIPREADVIYKRRYGDCKDMASILYVMLRHAGVNACYTWIGTRDLFYSYYDLPSPLCDNHMICAFNYQGVWHFLDGTTTYLPFGYPSGFIQGKEALIGIDENKYTIQKVPVMKPEASISSDTIQLRVENQTVVGKANSTFTGYFRENYMHSLVRYKDLSDIKALSSFFETGNNKFYLTAAKFSGLDDNNKELKINYEYGVPNYVKVIEKEMYINLNLDKYLNNDFLYPDKRKTSWEIDYCTEMSQHVEFIIPEGYELDKLPKNVSYTDKDFAFDIKYSKEKNVITMDRQIILGTLYVNKADFKRWNEMIEKLSLAYKDVVTLSKIK